MRDRELASAYVLGELDFRARADFERRLAEDAELRAEVAALEPLAARLSELPAQAWPEPLPTPTPRPRPQRRRWSVRPALALAAVLAALLVGAGAGALFAGGGDGGSGAPNPPRLTLSGLGPERAASGLVSMPSAGEMLLRVHGLPPTAAGQYYELWLLGSGDQTVPVVSFKVGEAGTATVRVPLPVDPASYSFFDVSRQRAAAGTAHSGDSVLRGSTAPS
jgi:Anti-sigma-K factor rskA